MSPTQNTIESKWLVILIAALFVLPLALLKAVREAICLILRPIRKRVQCDLNAILAMNKTFVGIDKILAFVKWNGLNSFRRPMAWQLIPVPRNRDVRRR